MNTNPNPKKLSVPFFKSKTMDTIKLGRAQMDVFLLTIEGLTSREIAQKKGVSKKTIEAERYSILKKFGAKNMIEAVAKAFMMGMIAEPDLFVLKYKTRTIKYLRDGKVAVKKMLIK